MLNSTTFCESEIHIAIKCASEYLGFSDGFRNEQSQALASFLRGHDLFVSLPTGFGKSVVFQAAPVCVDFLLNLGEEIVSTVMRGVHRKTKLILPTMMRAIMLLQ